MSIESMYLTQFNPMRKAKIVAALERQFRFNGVFMTRETAARILARRDGVRRDNGRLYSFNSDVGLEVFNTVADLTDTTIDYVLWLHDQQECSICRDRHPNDDRHPCE